MKRLHCVVGGLAAGVLLLQPLTALALDGADVERAAPDRVTISWRGDDPVDVYVSNRPDASIAAARLLTRADVRGVFVVERMGPARPYFILKDQRDGSLRAGCRAIAAARPRLELPRSRRLSRRRRQTRPLGTDLSVRRHAAADRRRFPLSGAAGHRRRHRPALDRGAAARARSPAPETRRALSRQGLSRRRGLRAGGDQRA